jgi:hypothetical protein
MGARAVLIGVGLLMVSVFNRQPSNELPMANVDLPVLAGDSSMTPRLSLNQSNEDQEFKDGNMLCMATRIV